jgi:hypothetical protein
VHPNLLSTVSAADALGYLSLDGSSLILTFWAAVRVIRAPRQWFSFGIASKLAWLLASLWFTIEVSDVVVPLGALVVLWHLRSLSRRQAGGQPADLPFAAGSPMTKDGDR